MNSLKPVLLTSDAHLGAAPPERERAFTAWLEHAAGAASWIILNGDVFDFWYEYRWGTTRGHERVLEILRDIVEGGVPVTLMGGNHDWWGGAYLRDEIGVEFLQRPVVREIGGRTTFLAHGDGLGRGDAGYRLLRAVLRGSLTRGAFGLLPPTIGDGIARWVSATEDRTTPRDDQVERSAALERWAARKLHDQPELELVVLGHTHLPLVREVCPGRWYANTGDWIFHGSYLELAQGCQPRLARWET